MRTLRCGPMRRFFSARAPGLLAMMMAGRGSSPSCLKTRVSESPLRISTVCQCGAGATGIVAVSESRGGTKATRAVSPTAGVEGPVGTALVVWITCLAGNDRATSPCMPAGGGSVTTLVVGALLIGGSATSTLAICAFSTAVSSASGWTRSIEASGARPSQIATATAMRMLAIQWEWEPRADARAA